MSTPPPLFFFLNKALGGASYPLSSPCHLPRLTAKNTGRKCLLPTSLMSFLFLYCWSVKIVYKFTDHTDVLLRCFFLWITYVHKRFTPALALNRRRSGFKDVTLQLVVSPQVFNGHLSIDCSQGIVVCSWLLSHRQEPDSRNKFWLRQPCKHPTEAVSIESMGGITKAAQVRWKGNRGTGFGDAAHWGCPTPILGLRFFV